MLKGLLLREPSSHSFGRALGSKDLVLEARDLFFL